MTTPAFDDREHRRGLVLGLTLSEVLLLLLFLLMLALAWRLSIAKELFDDASNEIEDLQKEVQELHIQLGGYAAIRAQLEAIVASGSLDDAVKQLGELAQLRTELSALRAENEAIVAATDLQELDPESIALLNQLVLAARAANPTDPPAVLREVTALIEIVGPAAGKLDTLVNALEAAKKINPGDPPAALVSGFNYANTIKSTLASQALDAMPAEEVASNAAANVRAGKLGDHNWPPIISLSEADGYYFQVGRAELSPPFREKLGGDIVGLLKDMIQQYRVDVIEIIGHTDEQPLAPKVSNLDTALVSVLRTGEDASALLPADNAGLGMSRATAVAEVLLADPTLAAINILPLSAAQVVETGDRLTTGASAGDVRERRRIEIRVRRSADLERMLQSGGTARSE